MLNENERIALLRSDMVAFIEKVFETVSPGAKYLPNWHIELVCQYILEVQKGEIKRLLINLPPRHLKSIIVSVAFPAWLLGHDPRTQIICASYSQRLSEKLGNDCRLVMQSDWYKQIFPQTIISETQNTQKKFVTTRQGHRMATSVGGTLTGEGAEYLIVDDAMNAAEAISPRMRESTCDWFDQALYSRLNNKTTGRIIVIEQRLHEGDLSGHLLKKDEWTHLKLPLVAEKREWLIKGKIMHLREVGDILQPAKFGQQEIEREKANSSLTWAGQYQQRPAPEGGGVFKKEWIQYYDKVSIVGMTRYILVDPADSKSKTSDYTAVFVIGLGKDENIYVLDIIRDKLNLPERQQMLFKLHEKYKPKAVYYQKFGMEGDIQHMKVMMEKENYRFPITQLTVKMDKDMRIRRLQSHFYENRLWFPKVLWKANYALQEIDVMADFEREYLLYPVSTHDDMLDALAMICDFPLQFPGSANKVDYAKLYGNVSW